MQVQAIKSDGELEFTLEEPAAETLPTDKTKTKLFFPPGIKLWDRPYDDLLGYARVELYADPGVGGWHYRVLMYRLKDEKASVSKDLHGGPFHTPEAAQDAGLLAYQEYVQSQLNKPKVKKALEMIGMLLIGLVGVSFIIAVVILMLEPFSKALH
jgi:hypothetical protein